MNQLFAKPTTLFLILFCGLFFFSCDKDSPNQMIRVEGVNFSNTLQSQNVRQILEDNDGMIWIATDGGLNVHNRQSNISFFAPNDSTGLNPSTVWSVLEDHSNRLWVSSRDGIYLLEGAFMWRQVPIKPTSMVVTHILENSNKEIFAGNGRVLMKYNPETNVFLRVKVLPEDISGIYNAGYIDGSDNFWYILDDKIILIDKETYSDSIKQIVSSPIISSAFINDYIWMVHQDGKTDVLDLRRNAFIDIPETIQDNERFSSSLITSVHALKSGIAFVSIEDNIFFYNTSKDDLKIDTRFCQNTISTVYEDSKGNYWIGYAESGYEFVDNSLHLSLGEDQIQRVLDGQNIHSAFKDCDGNLWTLSSKNNVYRLDPLSDDVQEIDMTSIVDPLNPEGVTVDSMLGDVHDSSIIWLLSRNTLYKCKLIGARLSLVQKISTGSSSMTSLFQSSSGKIIVAGLGHDAYILDKWELSLRRLHISDSAASKVKDMIEIREDLFLFCCDFRDVYSINIVTGELRSEQIAPRYFAPTCLCSSSDGDIWVSVNSNGLYRFRYGSNSIEKVAFDATLYPNSIIEDDGFLWVASMDGLFRYDVFSGKTSRVFHTNDKNYLFNQVKAIKLNDGNIVFGRPDGLTIINPNTYAFKDSYPSLFVSRASTIKGTYMVFDPSVKENLINLSSSERTVSFVVSSPHYGYSSSYKVGYMLSGQDNTWRMANAHDALYYSRLPYGRSVLKVAAFDDEGDMVSEPRTLKIAVKRPFMSSIIMMTIYVLIVVAIFLLLLNLFSGIYKEKMKSKKAQMENEFIKEVNEKNLDFFSNISHEFRTPLTMILGAASVLSKQEGLDPSENKFTRLLVRNATKMQKLVDQLLDMNKAENNAIKLKVKMVEAVSVLKDLTESFRITAESKGINLQFESSEDSIFGMVDEYVVENAMYNLLSNALKFTPSSGNISVKVDVIDYETAADKYRVAIEDNYLKVSVIDSGVGIPEDKMEVIFNKYYQVNNNKQIGGTGIGLYFTHLLLRLHHGDIIAKNPDTEPGKKVVGTELSFVIPVSQKSYTEDEKASAEETKTVIANPEVKNENTQKVSLAETPEIESEIKKTVLAVDDDPEVLYYLKSILSPVYKVVTKFDANSGFGCLGEIKPDIVISDVLMLDVDGFEFCSMIKNSEEFGNLPVILLTAKTSNEDKIKGLEVNADAYVTKPFDPDYLLALINNLLIKKTDERKAVSSSTLANKEKLDEILREKDKQFMTDLYTLMENDIKNEELDVTSIYEKMGMGRTSFYNRVKDITGESPGTLFRTYKLNRAKELLEGGKYKISAVAEMTGFCSPSYFSALFKKQFGISPKEFVQTKL